MACYQDRTGSDPGLLVNNNATALVVLSSATSLAVPNCATVSATAESAEIIFSAADGP